MTDISVVVPVYNEGENIAAFFSELEKSLSALKVGYEILAVDDGSTDYTNKELGKIAERNKFVRIFKLRKNFGKSAAYLVGFTRAKGKLILTIDSDGQDDPGEIKKLLSKLNGGFDVVVGWRSNRMDSFSKIAQSAVWNYFLSLSSGLKLHDVDCGLKLFRKIVLKKEYFRGDFHRYLPVVAGMDGYRVTEVSVIHRRRKFGMSKYSILKIFPATFDFITNIFMARFGYRPMHFFGSIGMVVFITGMVINFYLSILKIGGQAIGGRPLLVLGLLLTISGLQFIFTGFIADLVIRDNNPGNTDYFDNE